MGVRIIAFTVGVQREIIKRMLQLAVKNWNRYEPRPNYGYAFHCEKKKERINLKWMELSYSFCLASPW